MHQKSRINFDCLEKKGRRFVKFSSFYHCSDNNNLNKVKPAHMKPKSRGNNFYYLLNFWLPLELLLQFETHKIQHVTSAWGIINKYQNHPFRPHFAMLTFEELLPNIPTSTLFWHYHIFLLFVSPLE